MTLQNTEIEIYTEKQCPDYLFNMRWSKGYRCPRCRHDKKLDIKDFKYKCLNCDYQTTVTAGTLFQDTQYKMLPAWFKAIQFVTSQTSCTNALEMQKTLGLGSYRTSLLMLHKLRHAMCSSKQVKLCGTIEVGRSYIGKHEIAVAVEVRNDKIGQIRLNVIKKDGINNLRTFVESNVKLRSNIKSDKNYIDARNKKLPNAVNVIDKLKKWLPKILTGYFTSEHLDYYLGEYCFKFNRRNSRKNLFDELLQNAVNTKPIPYKEIKK